MAPPATPTLVPISWLVMAGRNYRLCFIARYAAQLALLSHSFGAWPRPLEISPKEDPPRPAPGELA